jgi:hypothetical protein
MRRYRRRSSPCRSSRAPLELRLPVAAARAFRGYHAGDRSGEVGLLEQRAHLGTSPPGRKTSRFSR